MLLEGPLQLFLGHQVRVASACLDPRGFSTVILRGAALLLRVLVALLRTACLSFLLRAPANRPEDDNKRQQSGAQENYGGLGAGEDE